MLLSIGNIYSLIKCSKGIMQKDFRVAIVTNLGKYFK